MNFLQRRGHLFKWILISIILAVGFILSAYYALQDPLKDDIADQMPYFPTATLDSLYILELDTEFVLKKRDSETYFEAKVLSPLPMTTLKVYQKDRYLGSINSKGSHILKTPGAKIGKLKFVDLIKGELTY
jgi:hypothetical protein